MKKHITHLVSGATIGFLMISNAVSSVFAAESDLGGSTTGFLCPSGSGIKPPGCGGNVQVGSIISFVVNALLFVAFIVALIFLIIGGIRWIMSGGDKEATGKAKSTVTSALIGLVVVLAAWILINIILKVLTGSDLGNLTVPDLNVYLK